MQHFIKQGEVHVVGNLYLEVYVSAFPGCWSGSKMLTLVEKPQLSVGVAEGASTSSIERGGVWLEIDDANQLMRFIEAGEMRNLVDWLKPKGKSMNEMALVIAQAAGIASQKPLASSVTAAADAEQGAAHSGAAAAVAEEGTDHRSPNSSLN